ncbi:MAG: hypothetical protein WBD31_00395 [Rubripirellula sp.]
MNRDTAAWLMHHLDGDTSMAVGASTPETIEWLETQDFPWALGMMLRHSWPQDDCSVGPVEFCSADAIRDMPYADELLGQKLLPIGTAPNGDMFVLDYSFDSCPVGFVTHEGFSGDDPRGHFNAVCRSLESFLYRVDLGLFIPCDYYSTGHFNDFLKAEAEHQCFPPFDKK